MRIDKYDPSILQSLTATNMITLIKDLRDIAKINTNKCKMIVSEADRLISMHERYAER